MPNQLRNNLGFVIGAMLATAGAFKLAGFLEAHNSKPSQHETRVIPWTEFEEAKAMTLGWRDGKQEPALALIKKLDLKVKYTATRLRAVVCSWRGVLPPKTLLALRESNLFATIEPAPDLELVKKKEKTVSDELVFAERKFHYFEIKQGDQVWRTSKIYLRAYPDFPEVTFEVSHASSSRLASRKSTEKVRVFGSFSVSEVTGTARDP